jgi:hypothetical protein
MNTQRKSPPSGVGFNSNPSGLSPLEIILNRLDGVRKSGKGHICRCPAHSDRSASLSITEADNGNALIHCFAGCSALSIVQALGLEMADLYPRRITENMSALERTQARQAAKHAGILAALGVLALEVEIILIGGFASIAGTVTVPDLERMAIAVKRIQDIKAVLHGR